MTDNVFIRPHDEIDRIAPEIYGHFAEHLGRCIYGGIWVGEDDPLSTTDGVREDTVELLRDLEIPVLRWSGGCFADDYHWEDGIGPREERPRRRNLWWTQGRENVPEESNQFGTDEFLQFCRLVDTEPYLALNVGSGSPTEAVDWVEYCNYDGDTEYANRRRQNGQEEPYDVTYWGVGNENWGCGGRYDPETYGEEFRRYANYLQGYDRIMGDGSLELIGCGHITDDWNRKFMESVGGTSRTSEDSAYHLLDHLSIHRYYDCGDSTDFTDEQYYKLFARSLAVADDVDKAAKVLDTYAPGTDIGVIVDEWGVWHWHANAKRAAGLEQENTVRDALTAAGVLDAFNARADVLTMANLAQTVNVLQCIIQTDEASAWATPTYQVFDLYKPHMGSTAFRTVVDTEIMDLDGEDHDVPLVSASASQSDNGLFVTLSNRDLDGRQVAVDTGFGTHFSDVSAKILFADQNPREYSTSENADEFTAGTIDADVNSNGEIVVDIPGSSVVSLAARP
ncbi:alpha-N-arabinofuranosidase [Halegenticoccus soli]|uniref:alpha-N-arabinofuranosidase n=1 Tax=Halegenticoccus soli TaxID=1985678 RepID=UPI000C6D70A1|nr:alpha-L-arabinofuranosidase C-terminal domain-containing protein [Halegenticoccus soli]